MPLNYKHAPNLLCWYCEIECQCHVLLSIGLFEYVNIHKINSLRLKVCEICRFTCIYTMTLAYDLESQCHIVMWLLMLMFM